MLGTQLCETDGTLVRVYNNCLVTSRNENSNPTPLLYDRTVKQIVDHAYIQFEKHNVVSTWFDQSFLTSQSICYQHNTGFNNGVITFPQGSHVKIWFYTKFESTSYPVLNLTCILRNSGSVQNTSVHKLQIVNGVCSGELLLANRSGTVYWFNEVVLKWEFQEITTVKDFVLIVMTK